MCGICGVISPDLLPNAAILLGRMNDSLKHRGPDDAGYWLYGEGRGQHLADQTSAAGIQKSLPLLAANMSASVALGHRRLSIIDLSTASHQPIQSASARYVLSYNGELYNYIELRAALMALGYQFTTIGDAEVLLAAWEAWQEEALHRFEGMWAFALYDLQLQKLWLVRDPSGVKPLFYSKVDDVLLFASEPKALLASGLIQPTLREEALYAFLVHASLDESDGHLLKEVQELAPGHLIAYDAKNGLIRARNYHQKDFQSALAKQKSHKDLTRDIRERLENAVQLRLRSDVKIGASLSGGLDSATLAVLAAKTEKFPLFTAVYNGFPENEAHYAKEVAAKLQADWHEVQVYPAAIVDRLEEIVRIQDGPILALSTLAQLLINEAAKKQGVSILLDGQGGDELFSGYDRYWLSFYREAWEKLQFKTLAQAALSESQRNIMLKSFTFSFLPGLLLNSRTNPFLKKQLENRKIELKYLQSTYKKKYWPISERYLQKVPLNSVNAQQIQEMYGHDLKNLLRWGDRNSMSVAIENRAPFADDPHLAQLLLQLPAALKMKSGQSKLLLRKAMANDLPSAILNRKDKQGFTTPMKAWMKELWPQWQAYLAYLPESIDVKSVEKDQHELLRTNEGAAFLLRLVSLGAWLKNLQHSTKSA